MRDDLLAPLFQPFQLKHLTLRNRFVMPAMQIGRIVDNKPTPELTEYYRGRAEGGVGLVFSESCGPDHPSSYWQPVFGVLTEYSLEAWEKVVEAVKGAGAHFFFQIGHPGAMRRPSSGMPHENYPSLSPSGLIQAGRSNGRAATLQELDEIKVAFVRAAEHAKLIGAQGVEVHACHGYFLDQFLWAETNLREDKYGGATLIERARYACEIVSEIRRAVGAAFCISFRISQFKEADYGAKVFASPDELGDFLDLMAASGVDCINVSARRFYRPEWPDLDAQRGLAGWAKSRTHLPVITCGSIGISADMFADLLDNEDTFLRVAPDLEDLVQRFNRGEFDLMAAGRIHIANSDFVKKIGQGKLSTLINYKKHIHLANFFGEYQEGVVEEFKKVSES